MAKRKDPPTFDDMVDYGVSQVIKAFGKGEDLRGAVSSIVMVTAQWGADNRDRHKESIKKSS